MAFNVNSVDGLREKRKDLFEKANGIVDVKGQITPKGEIDTVAVGDRCAWNNPKTFCQMGLDLQGLADFKPS